MDTHIRRWRALAVASLALLLSGVSLAQAPAPVHVAASAAKAPPRPGAELVVFNRPIVRLQSTFLGVPADERAQIAHDRIVMLLGRGGPGQVTTEEAPQGTVFKIDGALAFVLAKEDVDPLAADAMESVVPQAVHALEQAIAETREARSTRFMLTALLWAAGATLVYALVFWTLLRLGSFVMRRTLRFAREKTGRLRVGGAELLQRERMLSLVRGLVRIAGWVLLIVLTYEWLGFVLGLFPYTRPWSEQLNAFTGETALGFLAAAAHAAPDLVIVALILVVARWIVATLGHFFDGVRSKRIHVDWVDADSAQPTRRIVSVAVWLFALVMAYPYIPGSGSDAFKGLSVLIGLMVSLGGASVVGQAASGLILMYSRTLRQGEYVRIGDQEGTVVELRTYVTRIRTGLGEEVTLPNALVLSSVVKNYSRTVVGQGYIADTTVTIGYDVPWRQVHALLVEAASRASGILAEPRPRVYQTALSDFYVEYRLVCQATASDPRSRAEILSTLHEAIQDLFNEHGVQIMSPHYLGDPSEPKIVPKAQWYAPPATRD
jgi:small-conductance mechanosensitive channel